ncbi:MAG: hypothetical protein Q8O19_03630 [Rectinemataceae bacterium]|nr:hypothetical protein [Rectinemataceae bacterium]
MEIFDAQQAVNGMYEDITASFLALANALHAKGVLTKNELAESAQERLLECAGTAGLPGTDKFVLLRCLAVAFERSPDK